MTKLEKCRLEEAVSDYWFLDKRNEQFIVDKIASQLPKENSLLV